MKTKVQLEWEDYLEAQLLNLRPSRLVQFALLMWGLSIASGLLVSVIEGYDAPYEEFFVFGFVIVGLLVFRFLLFPRRIQYIFRQQKSLSVPFEIELMETGLGTSNEFGHSQQPWANYTKWKENKIIFLLFYSDVMIQMLPKRFFTDSQLNSIRNNLQRSNVPNADSRKNPLRSVFICLLIVIPIVALVFQLIELLT